MSVLLDIAETYIRPARVMRRKVRAGVREPQLLAIVMLASLIATLSRLPALLSAAQTGSAPVEALVGTALIAGMLFAPLFFYALAALSHGVTRLLGGQGSGQGARLALFWSLLALQPLVIATIYLPRLLGPGALSGLVVAGFGLWFLWVWLAGLRAVAWSEVS